MNRPARKYRLLIYRRTLDHWWHRLVALGIAVFALSLGLRLWEAETWRWRSMAALGVCVGIAGILLLALRNLAYVQPRRDHLRLATPFLRMNISYRRILRTSTAMMQEVFPAAGTSRRRRYLLRPLSHHTAVILELRGFPFPRPILRLFLSPFFFAPDRPSQLVLLIDDWMQFSADLTAHGAAASARSSSSSASITPGLAQQFWVVNPIARPAVAGNAQARCS